MYKYHLNDVEWGEFELKDYFEFYLSKGDNQADLLSVGIVPLISSGRSDNGICKFIEKGDGKSEIFDKNLITVDMFGKPFFHPYKFYAVSHGRINILKEKQTMSNYVKKFIIKAIEKSTERIFSYNRMCSQKRLLTIRIMLPLDKTGNPNWHFMEEYIKEREDKQRNDLKEYYKSRLLDLVICPEVLTDVEWGEFFLGDIFSINTKSSKGLNHLSKDDKKGIPYLGATNRNNGVLDFVEKDSKLQYDGNCIAFIRDGEGSMGYSIYKRESFIATPNISVGYNENLNEYSAKFITTVADRVRGKYTFGYKRNQARLKKEILTLPIDKAGNPNWIYMENFIKNIEQKQIKNILKYLDRYIYIYIYIMYNHFDKVEWKEFFVEDVAEILSGKDIYEKERVDGEIPYITATANNNGVGFFVSNTNSTKEANCISVNRSGSVGYSFYHPYEALYGNNTRKLRPIRNNKYVSLFIANSISRQKEKYSYGYIMGTERLKRQKIMLPVDEESNINYYAIEKYMKANELKQIINILTTCEDRASTVTGKKN